MNVSKISVTENQDHEIKNGVEIIYTRLQVTLENGNAKYIELVHPIDIKTAIAGFHTLSMMLNKLT